MRLLEGELHKAYTITYVRRRATPRQSTVNVRAACVVIKAHSFTIVTHFMLALKHHIHMCLQLVTPTTDDRQTGDSI